eukprot:11411637-Alexandrium_andersonii.AAC.1
MRSTLGLRQDSHATFCALAQAVSMTPGEQDDLMRDLAHASALLDAGHDAQDVACAVASLSAT